MIDITGIGDRIGPEYAHLHHFTRKTLAAFLERGKFADVEISTRTGAGSWIRSMRCLSNGVLKTKMYKEDPGWQLAAAEVPAFISGLFRYFGVGSELRVCCRKPATADAPARD